MLKIGPVKARFSRYVQLDTTGAPDSFSLTGQGNGGVAGHARGGADVTLTSDRPDRIILRYVPRPKSAENWPSWAVV